MKARICDFCGKTHSSAKNPELMLYDISIFSADGFAAELDTEKGLMYEAEDVCPDCTLRVREVLEKLKKELAQ